MTKTVVGLFDTFAEAQHVVQDLVNTGFRREDISLLANDARGEYQNYRTVGEDTTSAAAEGAGAGAVGGGVLGGVLGLLVGVGALAIPGIGPVLAAGPLAAALGTAGASTLVGAGIGAATGGLIGALVGAGIPEEDASFYAEGVRRGGALVMVKTSDELAQSAYDTLRSHGAVDVDERSGAWRQSGWTGFNPNAEPYSSDADEKWERSSKVGTVGGTVAGAATGAVVGSAAGPVGTVIGGVAGGVAGAGLGAAGDVAGETLEDYATYDADFRSHYRNNYANSGYTYDQYSSVYRYGYDLARDQRYRDRDWSVVEPEARRRWEEHNPNTWERFKESVRYAWDKARGAR
jgi:heat induced stress protein YflT